MKLQISWGWKIALLYCGFVLMILVLVGMSVSQKIDLVADDYYAMELAHQQKIDKMGRSGRLEEPITWKVGEEYLEIVFPGNLSGKAIGGNVILYCPADNRNDFSVPVKPGSDGVQRISRSSLKPGRYHLQLDWSADNTTYWDEGVIRIVN